MLTAPFQTFTPRRIMDQVEQVIRVPSNRWIWQKNGRVLSAPGQSDHTPGTASCPIWQSRIAGVRGRCIRKNCRKPSSSLQLTMPSMAEKIRPRARTARPTPWKSPLAEGLSIRWPTASVPASCSLTWAWKRISRVT